MGITSELTNPARYCSRCGAQRIKETRETTFDTSTGKRKQQERTRCPKWYQETFLIWLKRGMRYEIHDCTDWSESWESRYLGTSSLSLLGWRIPVPEEPVLTEEQKKIVDDAIKEVSS